MKRILLVDDEQEIVSGLSNILKMHGYDVIASMTGEDALVKAKRQKPDAIILDIFLPDIDGEKVALMLSKEEITAKIPIIFLSALISKYYAAKGKLGRRYILAKPCSSEKLLKVLKHVLESEPIK